jgi:hypothetical protein
VDCIVNDNSAQQQRGGYQSEFAQRRDDQPTQQQQHGGAKPNFPGADPAGNNRPFLPVLPIEIHVKSIIEEHAARIKQRSPGTQQGELLKAAASGQEPCGQAIGPNRWQIGDSAKH